MNNYCYQLDIPVLSAEEKFSLIEVAASHRDEFISYVPASKEPDGNQLWRGDDLYVVPCVKRLVDSCNLETIPVFVRHQPKVSVYKHTDDYKIRRTVLSIPLTPTVNYPPTYFFETRKHETPAAIASYENLNACLLNTQEVHGLINTSTQVRINFQLCFKEDFAEVRDMIIAGTLFKSDTSC